mmetsp:Transcript_61881/g.166365  ORF Transcript_61881/g.166365 Transcript_61881/m.166365 type:complete len:237 (-) Transcript_61881:252-962(-)
MGVNHMAARTSKIVHFVRHGQAMHNPRAEAARAEDLMREDDAPDAELTPLGRGQAEEVRARIAGTAAFVGIDLVCASTLSRALETADLIFPPEAAPEIPRVPLDDLREISGLLTNAKRRSRTELEAKFQGGGWQFSALATEHDELWTPEELEPHAQVAERGYRALKWIWQRRERNVLVVAHGGIYHFLFKSPGHPCVTADPVTSARFHNCEFKSCRIEVSSEDPLVFTIEALAAQE